MKLFPVKGKRVFAIVLVALGGLGAAAIYDLATRDPVPIRLNPKTYDDYVGELPWLPAWTNGMVAATTGGAAVQAGLDVLKEGGSAADAAMATALCEVTHAGGSYVSFAGIILMTYYDAASGAVYFLDAQFQTPLEEDHPRSMPTTGGRTALVPGFMAGVQTAHARFGKLPFKRLFEPAIKLAEEGEMVSPTMGWWLNSKKSVLSRFPETKSVFTKSNGKFMARAICSVSPSLPKR